MKPQPTNPLIVQSDSTLLLETQHPLFASARTAIVPFAELHKSPEYIHTYRLTPLSLWNAAATGMTAAEMIARLAQFARYTIPTIVVQQIQEIAGRWGRLTLRVIDETLQLQSSDPVLLRELLRHPEIQNVCGVPLGTQSVAVHPEQRGVLKQALVALGWPVDDQAGYTEGEQLVLQLRPTLTIRDYQAQAVDAFYADGSFRGGSGVIVLPPGSGKTVVGIAVLARLQQSVLVLTTSRTSIEQWRRELLSRTTLAAAHIVEYRGLGNQLAPVTLATYQMLTYRRASDDDFPHLGLFQGRNWGLIIYDEVHTLPAPIFRMTASIQALRRLGLTATLVREDGREVDVFALIGPKKFDLPWLDLAERGWIATAQCCEVRVALPDEERMAYAVAERRVQHRIAAENPRKLPLVRAILQRHSLAPTLIIGQYLEQLQYVADNLAVPLITGKTPQSERERLFEAFRRGEEPLLVISKVGNFAIDLPDAEVLIQISGAFGSRQEEAQRLGRVLRPKADQRQAFFYTLVSRDTTELDFAHSRQLFLAEQGYRYTILAASDLLPPRG
jgi:DNA excision repair protein ERCC-3